MIVYENPSWIRLLLIVRGSSVRHTWKRVVFTTAVACVVTYLHETQNMFHDNLTMAPFSLIGLALGIFLGFRNNTSYDRFWEGRKLWGRIVNTSRTLTRQLLTLIHSTDRGQSYLSTKDEGGPVVASAFQRRMVYRLIAYVHSLRLHLRDQDRLDELKEFLEPGDMESIRDELNRPVALLQQLGDEIRQAWDRGEINAYHVSVLEASLTEFTNVQGGCERIKSTPIPFSYNILLHRIVFLYCVGLPFGLVSDVTIITPVVVLLVSYAFFGLDAVGDEIENPFGEDDNDLPLSAITRMIEINLRERLGETKLPPLLKATNHVLT